METRTYRWRSRDRRWRKLRLREAARGLRKSGGNTKSAAKLRSALAVMLGLELTVGLGRAWAGRGADIQFLRREESCCVEWVEPGEAADGRQEVYGVRLKPESLELQFYHQTREILD